MIKITQILKKGFFTTIFFVGAFLITSCLQPNSAISFISPWSYAPPANYFMNWALPFSSGYFGINSPFFFPGNWIQPTFYNQSPLFSGWQGYASNWNGLSNPSLLASQGFSPGLTNFGLSSPITLPIISQTAPLMNPIFSGFMLNGLSGLAGQNAIFPGLATTYPMSALLLPNLLAPRARAAAITSPLPPPPPSPVGIDIPEIRQGLPVLLSLGNTYVPGQPSYVSGQVVVTFLPGTPLEEMLRVYSTHQCRELYASLLAGFKVVGLPPFLTVVEAAKRLSMEPSILYAGPNYYRHAHLIPNDPYFRYQWHLPRLNCTFAWDINTGTGALVGLLDSGISYQTVAPYGKAPDLAGTSIVPGYDFINNDPYPDDDYGHGTHMAGCIAQTTNNLLGVAGVAFSASIMPVKVMDNLGNSPITTEVEGIYYAANNGVNIINMSLGGAGTDATEQAAVTYAYNSGVTLVCSAGNAASSVPEYPASYTECLSISAIRYDNTKPTYSNYGQYIDVCAPGGDLSVDQNLDGFGDGILQQTHDGTNFATFYYYFMEGTSPAAALVSGVAALIVSKSTLPLTPLNVGNILKTSARDLGLLGWDQYYGSGLVNAYNALLQTP